MLRLAGFENAFLDMRRRSPGGEWTSEPQFCRALGYKSMRARWPEVLDALYYIREMKPATALRE